MKRSRLVSLFALLCLLVPAIGSATTISIVINDGAGEGFNDPTVVAPVGSNPGTTLGQQRLNVFQTAARIWSRVLRSDVEIVVSSQFNPQTCSTSGAVLGSAGTTTIHSDFTNAPMAGTWYHAALANMLSGTDLNGATAEINATFNSDLDNACLGPGTGWYYGMDDSVPAGLTNLLPVVLHEIGHGLGFANFINESNGQLVSGLPDIFSVFTYDNTAMKFWPAMTDAERIASAINTGNVVWDGANVNADAPSFLGKQPIMVINSPMGIAGTYAAQGASFGPTVVIPGVTGDVVLADDSTSTTSDACEALTNGGAISGNIALVDRGNCTFVLKVANAQAAGAIGVIVANNVATGLPPMGGSDPSITIPSLGISQADGNSIKANLPGTNATLTTDATQLSGSDATGHVLLYAPNPVQLGSSISHWDTTATPNLVMEPAITSTLFCQLDLTISLMRDIGWATYLFGDSFECGDTRQWGTVGP